VNRLVSGKCIVPARTATGVMCHSPGVTTVVIVSTSQKYNGSHVIHRDLVGARFKSSPTTWRCTHRPVVMTQIPSEQRSLKIIRIQPKDPEGQQEKEPVMNCQA